MGGDRSKICSCKENTEDLLQEQIQALQPSALRSRPKEEAVCRVCKASVSVAAGGAF